MEGKWELTLQAVLRLEFSVFNHFLLLVFIDDDNYGVSGNLSESPVDSEFPTYSASVCWRFLGDSVFHKKPSP